MCRLILR